MTSVQSKGESWQSAVLVTIGNISPSSNGKLRNTKNPSANGADQTAQKYLSRPFPISQAKYWESLNQQGWYSADKNWRRPQPTFNGVKGDALTPSSSELASTTSRRVIKRFKCFSSVGKTSFSAASQSYKWGLSSLSWDVMPEAPDKLYLKFRLWNFQ